MLPSIVPRSLPRRQRSTAAPPAAEPLPPEQQRAWETLAQQAVDAAMRAGAQYADARLTRNVVHRIGFAEIDGWQERTGVGVRALVNGYWGFAATPSGARPDVEQLARDAVAQAKLYAQGLPRTVELRTIPRATGTWTTPIQIDPFTVPFEEKLATVQYWCDCATQVNAAIDSLSSDLHFLRQERVTATSEHALFTQTAYESGGTVKVIATVKDLNSIELQLDRLTPLAKGWELVLDADIPGQMRTIPERAEATYAVQRNHKPAQIGRYALVCDGATMATLLDLTLGVATQLDRALGYETNSGGSSFLSDPLAMLGTFQVASPVVTVTANRSTPGQLATVKWDDEGVEPEDFTLIKDGILVDYQTTREQAAWLAPYYQKTGKPVRSHGCASIGSGLDIPLQQTPNLVLAPGANTVTIDDLVAGVEDGIMITEGETRVDFQSRTGILIGALREIKDGKLGRSLQGGALRYDTLDFWKHVTALGGPQTAVTAASSWYPYTAVGQRLLNTYPAKGEPAQHTSCSIQAVAAAIVGQTIIDLMRKG
jgi:TldD protein